jgi:dihydrofolate reductase
MARIQLYIAQSLDGYIAERDGGVAWIEAFLVEGEDYGYRAFLEGVEAAVMGATTYEQELARGHWGYGERPVWVCTHRRLEVPAAADVRFVSGPVEAIVGEIEHQVSGHVWLVGGGALARQFVDAGALDELILFVAPVLLGTGISLFGGTLPASATLTGTTEYATGLVELRYALTRAAAG